MDTKLEVVVIGAGPAGLSCAYKMAKNGHRVSVYEASPFIGGMSRSFELWGQIVDLGPHRFFSKQKNINQFFFEVVKDDYTLVDRQTRIYYNNNYFEYPLKLGNVLKNLSLATITKIMLNYGYQQVNPIKEPKNFEEWVTNRFGKKLYEIFFKNYTEKLWGISCKNIDADWAAQRIKSLSLFEAVKSAFLGNRGNKHKTLVDQFAYPNFGTGMIYQRTAEEIEKCGGKIFKQSPVKKVLLSDDSKKAVGIELMNGEQIKADYVVSTMPLTNMIKSLDVAPKKVLDAAESLYFRNTILVYLEIDKENLFTDNWLYIHAPNVRHGRITNFRNWSKELNGDKKTTIVCLEFWCFSEDKIWKDQDQNIIDLAEKEIFEINLIPKESKILNAKVIRIPKCYPVYEIGYQENLETIVNYLKKIDHLIPIGRYGSFKYNNQDHSILMGLLAYEKITSNNDVDLWEINTDTEYQEEGEIKDVLVQ